MVAPQVIEAFQYAFDQTPVARYDDAMVPIHRRLFRGPNTWPDADALPGFRPTVDELTSVYHSLTRELGHLICESLGEDPSAIDEIFDWDNPDLAASLSHNFSMARVKPELRDAVEQEYTKEVSKITGAHIDGPPFVALLVNDRLVPATPAIQIVTAKLTLIRASSQSWTAGDRSRRPVDRRSRDM